MYALKQNVGSDKCLMLAIVNHCRVITYAFERRSIGERKIFGKVFDESKLTIIRNLGHVYGYF
jgi:hypothetical protein